MSIGVSCSIVLSRTDDFLYWTGETISGNVILTADRSIKIKAIDVNLIGQVVSTITPYMSPYSNGFAQTITVRKKFCHERYRLVILPINGISYDERHPLVIPSINGISYDKDGYYLQPNTYQWSFSIRLPEHLPPSLLYVGDNVPHINYSLKVKISRSWLHLNIQRETPITVISSIPRPQNFSPIERREANFRDLYIYGKLLRDYLLTTEYYITLELDIQNPSQTTIKEIIVKLVQCRRLAKVSGEKVVFEQRLPGIVDFQNNHLHRIFQVRVLPSLRLSAPSSYYNHPKNPDLTYVVEYVFRVIIKTKLFFTNVTIEFPLMVVNSEDPPRPVAEQDI